MNRTVSLVLVLSLAAAVPLPLQGQLRPRPGGNVENARTQIPPPTIPAVSGRFRVYAAGFRVGRATVDDPLQLDGAGDEVALSGGSFRVSRDANVSTVLGAAWHSTVMGEASRAGVIQAGNATPRGGLRDGNRFPGGAPGAPLFRGNVFFDGTLTVGHDAVVVVPVLLEWDNADLSFHSSFVNDFQRARQSMARRAAAAITSPDPSLLERPGLASDLGFLGSAFPGPAGDLGPRTRPIGVWREEEQFVFLPRVLVFTYEGAEKAATTDAGFGPGIVPVQFRDTPELRGDYTLLLRVEHVT